MVSEGVEIGWAVEATGWVVVSDGIGDEDWVSWMEIDGGDWAVRRRCGAACRVVNGLNRDGGPVADDWDDDDGAGDGADGVADGSEALAGDDVGVVVMAEAVVETCAESTQSNQREGGCHLDRRSASGDRRRPEAVHRRGRWIR